MFVIDEIDDRKFDSKGLGVSDALAARLKLGSKSYLCGRYLHALDSVEFTHIIQTLEDERILRKSKEVLESVSLCNGDWNSAMMITLLRSLSDMKNRYNYISLGLSIDYYAIERERDSLLNLETMFLYSSGLLRTLPKDDFTESVRRNAEILARKYDLDEFSPLNWVNVSHVKHPIVRLSQAAQLYHKHDMLFNRVINCRNRDDVLSLFGNVEASDYWLPYVRDDKKRGSIGVMKGDMMAINLVVTMLYAYGIHFCNDEMVIAALGMLENLPAESNGYINGWRSRAIVPQNAYETQALIQLSDDYCKRGRCVECPVAKHISSAKSIIDRMPDFFY